MIFRKYFRNLKKKKEVCRNQRGVLFIEAALVLPFLIYLVVNMLYFAFYLHDYAYLNNITRSAARYAAVETSGESTDLTKKAENVGNYIKGDVANQLIVYNLDINSVGTAEPGDKNKAYGYISVSGVTGDRTIRVELGADRTEDFPILVNNLLPKVIVSSLKMRLEE